jgi:predicted DsbA family dithiol-disulfide isomerase
MYSICSVSIILSNLCTSSVKFSNRSIQPNKYAHELCDAIVSTRRTVTDTDMLLYGILADAGIDRRTFEQHFMWLKERLDGFKNAV